MPIYTDPYDSGGGTTTSVCRVSPSDELAVLGNIISRVADIERFLSKLVYADVHANNLSELADNMGNLINGAVMMPYSPNDSWSGVGGSIAVPEGFTGTFISGGVTTIWLDGVVTFEATPHGIMTGSATDNYLVTKPSTTTLSTNRPNIDGIMFDGGVAFGTDNLGTGRIDINQSGYYHIDIHLCVSFAAGAAVKKMTVNVIGPNFSVVDNCIFNSPTDTSNRNVLSASFGFEASAGNYIEIVFTGVSSLDATFYDDSIVTIEQLKRIP